ncbi:MAG: serine/threonine-protein kinase, partial [Vicinamibacterales bacterium]
RASIATGLPSDLQAQSARRLGIVAALYAFVFFVSSPVTEVLFPEDRAGFFSSPLRWAPSTLSISAALVVALLSWSRQIPVTVILKAGLVFEVVGSFGIACAQYLDVDRYGMNPPWGGLSWVAVWMLGFTMVIPSPPRWALLSAFASALAVPIVVAVGVTIAGVPLPVSPLRFFFQIVVPYLLVVLIAYVGARVVYRLGTQLSRARELGSYRLIERLGQGGMGEVWRAEHRLLARPAAVKLMRIDLAGQYGAGRTSELLARFEREAQATCSLRSPHTIELYDFGVAGDGTFYYVMELLDGFDLQVLVERFGPIEPWRAVRILKQVCHSLGEAHAAGLVHRDIKPANVYVCRYGRDVDFVKVLDFGLVKPQQAEGQTRLDITAENAARGTPGFMAPEQVVGDRPADGRSDIYALGCLGYWLITGRLVFTGRTAFETILQHVQAEPSPPSESSPTRIPRSFDDLILSCLAKNPDDRPATADVVAARLDAIEAHCEGSAESLRAWWDLHSPPALRPRQTETT